MKLWVSFSLWIFFYIIDFFINLQMSTECVFLNTATVIFCLIYCLNTPHYNQNLSFFFLLKAQYKSLQFFKIQNLAIFHHIAVIRMHAYMGPKVNSSMFEISLRGKIYLRCKVTSSSAFTWLQAKWNLLRSKFHLG